MFKLLPIPPSDATAAAAAPFLLQLNDTPAFKAASEPENWIKQILTWRNDGAITLHAALFLARYILQQTGIVSPGPQWGQLAVVEGLGQVNTTDLTIPCLRHLILHTGGLHYQVLSGGIKTELELRRAQDYRRTAGKNLCSGAAAPFLDFFQRAADALVPYLRP